MNCNVFRNLVIQESCFRELQRASFCFDQGFLPMLPSKHVLIFLIDCEIDKLMVLSEIKLFFKLQYHIYGTCIYVFNYYYHLGCHISHFQYIHCDFFFNELSYYYYFFFVHIYMTHQNLNLVEWHIYTISHHHVFFLLQAAWPRGWGGSDCLPQVCRGEEQSASDKHYCCPECKKPFAQKGDLERHYRIHTGEKPFACPICPYRATVKTSLQKHLRIHSGEKPYSCPFCPLRSSDKSNLMRHIKSRHRETT